MEPDQHSARKPDSRRQVSARFKQCQNRYLALRDISRVKKESEYAFNAGFAGGQAEKVFLGSAGGTMFCPDELDFDWFHPLAKRIAQTYRLHLRVLNFEGRREIWLLRDKASMKTLLQAFKEGDATFNRVRGKLCGIPDWLIDEKYDWRNGRTR